MEKQFTAIHYYQQLFHNFLFLEKCSLERHENVCN